MKRHILFVDDNGHFLDALQRLLHDQRNVWRLHCADSVDAALAAVERVAYDAIVSDVHMPVKDGFELVRALQANPATKDIPIALFTGAGDTTLKRRALECGATDLLVKPTSREDLLARLNSMLRLKTYQDHLKAHSETLDRTVREKTRELQRSRLEIIWSLSKAAEYRDEATGNHVVRVGYFSRMIAQALGLDSQQVETVFLTAPLHDIGKIGVPDRILLKPGRLTAAEWAVMQQHCVIGANLLRLQPRAARPDASGDFGELSSPSTVENPLLEMAADIAMSHHEWYNGRGYPCGLTGEAIPLEARIVALADVYDSLCSPRPYKAAFAPERALDIVRQEAPEHFDPTVYDAFLRSYDEIREVQSQFGNAGESGADDELGSFTELNVKHLLSSL